MITNIKDIKAREVLDSRGNPTVECDIILSDSSFGTLYQDGDDLPKGREVGEVKTVNAKVKHVKYSILYMKAIKALQEAMAKIESLEARVTTLEG